MLAHHQVSRAWLKTLLGIGWIGGLLLPVGYWARARQETAVACVLVAAGLLLIPPATNLLPTSPREWLGAVAGFVAGASLSRLAHFWGAHSTQGGPAPSSLA